MATKVFLHGNAHNAGRLIDQATVGVITSNTALTLTFDTYGRLILVKWSDYGLRRNRGQSSDAVILDEAANIIPNA